MRKADGLSGRQRRDLARLERTLAGDDVLTELVGLFAASPGPARRVRRRPTSRLRILSLCGFVVLAGIVATALGIVGAAVGGPVAVVAVVSGATAVTGGLAIMLTAATDRSGQSSTRQQL